jgi:CRISPR system Cascade subunit CasE
MKGFPGYKHAHEAGVLFSVEPQTYDGRVSVIIQSQQYPDWGRLIAKYGEAISVSNVKDLSRLQFSTGQILQFRLRANPVKTVSDSKGRLNNKGRIKKCRLPLLVETEQVTWLQGKGDIVRMEQIGKLSKPLQGGFEILPERCLTINEQSWSHLPKKKYAEEKGSTNPIQIQSVLYQGILRVTDPNAFLQNSIKQGIGPAKAFGCGLLMVRRA